MDLGLPALITKDEPAAWESCRIITPNLRRAYETKWKKFHRFSYPRQFRTEEAMEQGPALLELARAIRAANPDRLIFVDHDPHPYPLLLALSAVYGIRPLPPLYFHVYGDFLLQAPLWGKSQAILQRSRAIFISASGQQMSLLDRMFARPGHGGELCPFPVDTDHYRPSISLRTQWRKRLEIADQEFTLLYAGRMSAQKNVDQVLQKFAAFRRQTGIAARLLLAGKFDDLASPLFGAWDPPGTSFYNFQKALGEIPHEVRASIHYLGHLNKEDLVGVYNAADCYLSLSLHHDEDYGMAPAEALCCGTPTVLTAWGGYTGFLSEVGSDCRLVQVKLAKKTGIVLYPHTLFQALLHQSMLPHHDFSARQERAARYHERLSLEAVVDCLHAIHHKPLSPFAGFNKTFFQLALRMKRGAPYAQKGQKIAQHPIYKKIYSAYVGSSGVKIP